MRPQQPVSATSYKVTLRDCGASLILTGSEAQTVTGPDVDGTSAAPAGFFLRIYNRGAVDATFAPVSPQEPSYTIAVGACAALELGPDGVWLRE